MILYFVAKPTINRTAAEQLLPGRFESGFASRQVTTGPDGSHGVVFARSQDGLRFDAKTQHWQSVGVFPGKQVAGDVELGEDPAANQVEVWIGWERDKPPTPASLARPVDERLPGHSVKLAGQLWTIPQVREHTYDGSSVVYNIVLDRAAKYDAHLGWVSGDVVDRQRIYFDLAKEIYDAYSNPNVNEDGQPDGFTLPDNAIEIAAQLLAANYYLGSPEIGALGLIEFSFASVWSVLRLAIDEPGMIEMTQKKMASAGT